MIDALDRTAMAALDARLADRHAAALDHLCGRLSEDGVDAERLIEAVAALSVTAPSWALGRGGTRFGRFPIAGEPRDLLEKIDDVAVLNAVTGANRAVSLHIPWDVTDDPAAVRAHAAARSLEIDVVNSNTFQDAPETTRGGAVSYRLGSLASPSADARAAAVAHNVDCIRLGEALGARALSIWLPDGTNHPGQESHRTQFDRVAAGLAEIHDALPEGWLVFVEHKPFEPALYATVVADWGSALLLAQAAGPSARCLVDLGHHLPATNVEQVVSRLAMAGRLGGFHFNDARYADDDVTAGSVDPFRLFMIWLELLEGDGTVPDVAYMIDASHNVKDPLEDLAQSTEAIRIALAQALLVDPVALAAARAEGDVGRTSELLMAAFRTDVRPLVAEARRRRGGALDPIGALRAGGHRAAAAAARGSGHRSSGL